MFKFSKIPFAVSLLPFVGVPAMLAAATQPNIIVFLVDDMGAQDTSVPFAQNADGTDFISDLNTRYVTPNMERLARMGVKFTRAYACPVSSPSRVSLMTGANAARHRVTNWTKEKNSPNGDSAGTNITFQAWNYNGITPAGSGEVLNNAFSATCLPAVLKSNGYRTIHVGKAHFSAKTCLGANPLNVGFDVNIAGSADGGPGSYRASDNYSSGGWTISGLDEYAKQGLHLTQALTQAALKEIDTAKTVGKPFYLYMAHYTVHAPIQTDPDGLAWINANKSGADTSNYSQMVAGMDKSLGQILDRIYAKDDNGNYVDPTLAENTIIIFMSDNGGNPPGVGAGVGNLPFRNGKGSMFEGGIHEPMMVYWPGVTTAQTKNASPVIIEDFYPSILEMAGITNPTVAQTVDGKSFVSALRNGSTTTINAGRDMFFHYPNDWNAHTDNGNGGRAASAVISGDWKLIRFYENNTSMLFDLKNDISEATNLAATNPTKKAELETKLTTYLKSVDATMPISKATNLITYPDGSVTDTDGNPVDPTVEPEPMAGVLDFTGSKGSGAAVVAPTATSSNNLSGTETVSFNTSSGKTLSATFTPAGQVRGTGTGGQFSASSELTNPAAVTAFLGKAPTASDLSIWGDGITLETDSATVSVAIKGFSDNKWYRLKVLDMRKNAWYGTNTSTAASFSLSGNIGIKKAESVACYANKATTYTPQPSVTKTGTNFSVLHPTNNGTGGANTAVGACFTWEFSVPAGFSATDAVTFTAHGRSSICAISVEEIDSPGAIAYNAWKSVKFPAGTTVSPEEQAPEATPAKDTIVNLEKFVFDAAGTLDPTVPTSAFGQTGIVTENGADYLQVVFPYNPDASGVDLTAECFTEATPAWTNTGVSVSRDSTAKEITVKLIDAISPEKPKGAVRLTGTLDGNSFTTEPYGYEQITIPAGKGTTMFGLRVHKPFILRREIPAGDAHPFAATGTKGEVTITDAVLAERLDSAKSYIVEIITESEKTAGTEVSSPFIINRSAWRNISTLTKQANSVTFTSDLMAGFINGLNGKPILGYRVREAMTFADVFGAPDESGLISGTTRVADTVSVHILDKNLWSFSVNAAENWYSGSIKGAGVVPANTPIFYHRPVSIIRRTAREGSVIDYLLTGEVLSDSQRVHVYKSDVKFVSGLLFGESDTISKPAAEGEVEIDSLLAN